MNLQARNRPAEVQSGIAARESRLVAERASL